jgi:ethanolamine utilization protein EutN
MHLGKVTGNIVCTHKYKGMDGLKLMLVQPVDENLAARGGMLVAVDHVSSGVGDLINYTLGGEAALACRVDFYR